MVYFKLHLVREMRYGKSRNKRFRTFRYRKIINIGVERVTLDRHTTPSLIILLEQHDTRGLKSGKASLAASRMCLSQIEVIKVNLSIIYRIVIYRLKVCGITGPKPRLALGQLHCDASNRERWRFVTLTRDNTQTEQAAREMVQDAEHDRG